jgi:translocator assembly and maintenance protein 41
MVVLQHQLLRGLLSRFPPIKWAAAYGSAIYPSSNTRSQMLDLIIVPDIDIAQWHSQHMNSHPSDYAWIPRFVPGAAIWLQNASAGVFYNPYIQVFEQQQKLLVKYGVVTSRRLCQDLEDWTDLYLAGRLQKPVEVIVESQEIDSRIEVNRMNALRLMVKLLPNNVRIAEVDVYTQIAKLSYMGDVRFTLNAEQPTKAQEIVRRNFEAFKGVYRPLLSRLQEEEKGALLVSEDDFSVLKTDQFIGIEFENLPRNLRQKLFASSHYDISQCLHEIVRQSSISQSFKGILTGGIIRSARYIVEKLGKASNSGIK